MRARAERPELAGKTVVVVGLGKSGLAAAELCLRRGARVVANDAKPEGALSAEARALVARDGVELVAGGHAAVPWSRADLVVVSPGVPPLAELAAVEARGVPVVGELDFAWRHLADVPTAAITGSNGKSTTTTLVFEMLRAAGLRTFVGGNLDTPPASIAPGDGDAPASSRWDALVLEVSSFQAERAPAFHPRACALLNVSANHLDRYASFDAYVHAKGNLFVRQTPDDVAVVPHGDARCGAEAARGRGRVVTFGPGGDVAPEGDRLVDRARGEWYPRSLLRPAGEHVALDACAAIALARELGATHEAIRTALAGFAGLPHRTQLVAEAGGVRFYDDSKATSVAAAVAAIDGLAEPGIALVAGGRDKGGSYAPLVDALAERGRVVVVIGEAAELIARAASGRVAVERAATLGEAVERAFARARSGDAVLLSPACSSLDMFRSFEARGDAFRDAAVAIAARVSGARG